MAAGALDSASWRAFPKFLQEGVDLAQQPTPRLSIVPSHITEELEFGYHFPFA